VERPAEKPAADPARPAAVSQSDYLSQYDNYSAAPTGSAPVAPGHAPAPQAPAPSRAVTAFAPDTQVTAFYALNTRTVGALIGPKGCIIKALKERTGTAITILQPGERQELPGLGTFERAVQVRGRAAAVAGAESAMLAVLSTIDNGKGALVDNSSHLRQLTWPSGEAVVVAEGQEQIAAAGGAGAGAGACVTGGGGLDAATTAAGWQRFVDAATGAPYYHHAASGTTSWELPAGVGLAGEKAFPSPAEAAKAALQRVAAKVGRPDLGPLGAVQAGARSHPIGSWVCVACGNINFPGRTTCNRSVCGMPRSEVDGGDPGGPSPFSQPNAAAAAAAAADAAFAAAVAPKPSQPQPAAAAAAGGGATWTFKGMVFSGQQVLPSEATPIGAKGAQKGPKNPAIAPAPPPAKPALALLPIDDAEKRARVDRAARFASTAAERALQERRAAPAPTLEAGRVEGQSMALEKSYLRLTALPRADEVRPLPVLLEAFEMVRRRWEAEADYAYACEQLKAIRQDLTVQHLSLSDGPRARFALAVYEYHARLALRAGDEGEFAQCQAQLVPLHAAGLSEHAAEFAAYRLLHCAVARGGSLAEELRAIVGGLAPADAAAPPVAQALRLAVALQRGEFGTFFGECSRLHNLAAALLQPLLKPQRGRALRAVCAAFVPSLPLSRAAHLLGFGGDLAVCTQWLREQGAVLELHHSKGVVRGGLLLTRETGRAMRGPG